jgi:hypothetical protein
MLTFLTAGNCPGTKSLTMKREREREVGGSERHYGRGEQNLSWVLKVPRHCPFVLLVKD